LVQPTVEHIVAVEEKQQSRLVAIALFLAAPFIGLMYALTLPLVGMGMAAYMLFKMAMKSEKVRFYSTLVAAPFIGLAFALAMPIAGLGALVYMGGQAALRE
jgi:hypothetical protein